MSVLKSELFKKKKLDIDSMYNKSKTRIFETKKETINDKFSEYYLYLNNVIKFSDGLLNLYKNTQLNTKEIDSNALKEKLRVLGFSENDIKIETNLLEISNELKENIQRILKNYLVIILIILK